ncbi:MAG: FecR domain-containing protein [Elusimicrobia bacterium]|nr:FecR domain-containing protein [Elusimicrobiota bacterium]
MSAVGVLLFFGPGSAWAGAYLSKATGIVQLQRSGSERWDMVRDLPLDLVDQDTVRTGQRAQATLSFEDGSRVELGGNATFTLEEASRGRSAIRLNFGAIKAFVQKMASRRFEVKTPTAVCSVRGTEFRVEVLSGGRTIVDLYKGLLGVEDRRGQQILLHPNERIQIDLRGLNKPGGVPSQGQQKQSQFHQLMQREMAIEMSKADVLSAAAREIKLAEFQQGKALIDVNGNRVRLEEYIIRPTPNQFKLVVLNERASRFDFFYYLGTFNQTLPSDLSIALRQLSGTVDNPPAYFLTAFQTARSNTQDSIVENATGGHPVDVNSNGVPADQISFLFNPVTNAYDNVAGHKVYQTLFDNYGFYVNGGLKYGWTGANIQSYSLVTAASTNDPFTGALLPAALPTRSVSTTFPDPDQIHQVIYESYSNGTFIRWDNYIIDDQGKIARISDFQSPNSGVSYRQKILNFNFEQSVTATEFSGRKIDLVVEPKILVQAGLIQ